MKPRHLAQVRLARTVPGERAAEVRPLPARLHDRAELLGLTDVLERERPIVLHDRHVVPPKPYKMPTVGPYSPLLKRIVRHPFAMEPVEAVRTQRFDMSRPALERPGNGSPSLVFKESREARVRAAWVDHAVANRALPFMRLRQALVEKDERP